MTPELGYSYLAPSQLSIDRGGEGAEGSRLALATSGGQSVRGSNTVAATHPFFFSGFVERPTIVAQALLVVARVARTRFYVPPNTLAAVLRAADPVVTSTAAGLRFESFSACCGVYARLDIDHDALDASHSAVGVTNVDVNPPLRQALAGLRASEPLHLSVGHDELRVTTLDREVTEEKVPLPTRWLKGFAETQLLAAGMRLRHTLDASATRTFLQTLPKSSATKTVMWATPAARGLRLASRPGVGAACAAGPERLRVLEPLLRFATGLRVYGPEATAASLPMASAWVLELSGARLTIALSPEKSRGFSGEGAVLHALSSAEVEADADLLSALLAFEPSIDVSLLADRSALSAVRVQNSLSLLASSGLVGYDLSNMSYFHRPLPVNADALAILHPRLAAAHKLAGSGCVELQTSGVHLVRSGDTNYEVQLAENPTGDRCTCPWYAQHRGTRGPCKHVLAARIVNGGGGASHPLNTLIEETA